MVQQEDSLVQGLSDAAGGVSEICDIHDLRMDEYGCWVCGHAGPITDEVADTFDRWMMQE